MTTHRDSVQQTLDTATDQRIFKLEQDMNIVFEHCDRLYERQYLHWDFLEKLSDCVASPPPLPLKYK